MEQWRDVIGYEGLYQVSDWGNVRSVDRVVPHKQYGAAKWKGWTKKAGPYTKHGYLGVRLSKEGKETSKYVHRLVAEAWIGPCPAGQQVRHGPAGITDNSVSNLSYGTQSENELDKRRDGTDGGRQVIRSDGRVFPSLRVAAEESGDRRNIGACCNGRRKTAGGWGWAYYIGERP